jgi:nucleoside-diphosphate-sugar epimerase
MEDRRFDTARFAEVRPAAELLGWRAAVGLQDGLSRTVEWYRDHPVAPGVPG